MTPDPLSEKYYGISPYAFCNNSPMVFVDRDGRAYGDYYSYTGEFITSDNINDGKIYIVNNQYINNYKKSITQGYDSKLAIKELFKGAEEVGGLIVQNREIETENYTVSRFKSIGGKTAVSGFILEPSGPSTAVPNQNKRVPEGVYNIDNYSSKKYPSNFVLYNNLVPRERAIIYHIGNTHENTQGCMLPGTTHDGNGYVGNSTKKFNELKEFIDSIGARNIKVIVNNNIN